MQAGVGPVRWGPSLSLAAIPWGTIGVPLVVMAIVFAMIVPLPPFLLDFLVSANITISVIVLLVSMYITKPVEFSVFPTALLLLTLFRLALNVSSARLILLHGNTGTAAAGHVIEAFGNFVVGGNYIVGLVVFLVLIAIQYVVINHGAVRISEVTARFTLDAMPGKQMSIDSDLNAGLIDEKEARSRRKALNLEAEFYGAMDGASRFTQRDAVASILITVINIVAGFLIGALQHGMELRRALETYTVLTIGDGLVTVIPALMISISGGLIVTRASAESQISTEILRQVFRDAQPLWLATGVLGVMAVLPGLPGLPFLVLAGLTGTTGYRISRRTVTTPATVAATKPIAEKESLEASLAVEPLAVELGLGLVRLVEGGSSSTLMRRISAIRKQLATELGYILPPVRVTDNVALRAREYTISIKGAQIARYEVPAGVELAIPAGPISEEVPGTPTREPAFGIAAVWIPEGSAERARKAGYTLVDPVSVLGTHLGEVVRRHAYELFSRQDAKQLLDRVAAANPKAVEDLVPKLLPLASVQRVLQNLLRERVSIRDVGTIVESLGEGGAITRNVVLLTEFVRQAIRRMLIRPYLNANGELPAWFMDASIEQTIESAVEHGDASSHLGLAPATIRDISERILRAIPSPEMPVVAVTTSGARYFLRQITEAAAPNLFVVAHSEIPPGVRVLALGTVR